MITELRIKNFKSIKDESLKLSSLNLITGINSSGKSTLLQSILLLKQMNASKKTLSLNEHFVELGTIEDALHQFYRENKIEIGLTLNSKESFSMSINEPDKILDQDHAFITLDGNKSFLNGLLKNIKYLAAERMGAEFSYELGSNKNHLGKNGENTVSYIFENRSKNVSTKDLIHPNSKKAEGIEGNLLTNINEWMKEISPGINLEFSTNQKIRASSMSAVYYSSTLFNKVTPKNFGFGISYCLPIITLLLTSKKNDVILIENPEAHIHPTGQTKLGYLCAIAAKAGIQLIIESHSDHFFNGVRLALKDGIVKKTNLSIYYFDKKLEGESSSQNLSTIISSVELHEDGKIKSAPAGFFDEWQNSLFKLL